VKEGETTTDGKEEALTAVLYPHRRIRITELVQPRPPGSPPLDETPPPPPNTAALIEEALKEDAEDRALEAKEKVVEVKEVLPGAPPPPTPPSTPPSGATPTSFLTSHPISLVRITNLPTQPYTKSNQHIRAFTSELVSIFKDIAQLNPLFRDQITNFSINQVTSANIFDEPDKLADFAAAVSSGEPGELQGVLESTEVEERLRRALGVLKKELINAELASKLSREVEGKIAKRQREYYLMEQLRNIKKELNMESDGKDKLILSFKERFAKYFDATHSSAPPPAIVTKTFNEELAKLALLDPGQSEANVTRNYLEWIVGVPWGVFTRDRFELGEARRVLDEDHYGLEKVKERILEFLAVGRMRARFGVADKKDESDSASSSSSEDASKSTTQEGEKKPSATARAPTTTQGKIICLVGPPGVGKTSVGRSVARCVGRKFGRVSVGGLTDVAEVKGHRRTYVG